MPFQHLLTFVKQKLQFPQLRQTYVNWSIIALNYAIVPVNHFMKHLILVQGLDPNGNNNQSLRLAFDTIFARSGEGPADSSYDRKWVKEKFEKVRQGLKWGDLTQETFIKLTDVSKLSDPPVPVKTVSEASLDTPEGRAVLHAKLAADALAIDLDPIEEFAEPLNKETVDQVVPVLSAEKDNEREKTNKPLIGKELDYVMNFTDEINKFAKLLDNTFLTDKQEELGPEETRELIARAATLKEVKDFSKKYCEEEFSKVEKPQIAKIGGKKVLQKTTAKETDKVQLSEAQDLAIEMVARGLCENPDLQVAEIMKFPRNSFDSLKKVVLRRPITSSIDKLATKDAKKIQERDALGRFKGNFKRSPRR